jgi:hypothetical protein
VAIGTWDDANEVFAALSLRLSGTRLLNSESDQRREEKNSNTASRANHRILPSIRRRRPKQQQIKAIRISSGPDVAAFAMTLPHLPTAATPS